eukprot:4698294-Alexandrium_andersonii.AAC.1
MGVATGAGMHERAQVSTGRAHGARARCVRHMRAQGKQGQRRVGAAWATGPRRRAAPSVIQSGPPSANRDPAQGAGP